MEMNNEKDLVDGEIARLSAKAVLSPLSDEEILAGFVYVSTTDNIPVKSSLLHCPSAKQKDFDATDSIRTGSAGHYVGCAGSSVPDSTGQRDVYFPPASTGEGPIGANGIFSPILGRSNSAAYSPSKATGSEDIGDGMSNTILIGESSRGVSEEFIPFRPGWAFGARGKYVLIAPPDIFRHVLVSIYAAKSVGEHRINANFDFFSDVFSQNSQCFNSNHPGGAQFAFADGSVKFFDEGTDLNTLQSLATMDRGEVVREP